MRARRSTAVLMLALPLALVKTMLERLYKKAQVAGRVELAHWARERGVIEPRSR